MIIYIAGRITGQFDYMERFAKAERYLKRQGHIVINPARLPQGLKDYMPTCKALIDQADAVYFLHDWKESKGAREEHEYASFLNKQIIFEPKEESVAYPDYWQGEAIKAIMDLQRLKINIAEATQKAGVK